MGSTSPVLPRTGLSAAGSWLPLHQRNYCLPDGFPTGMLDVKRPRYAPSVRFFGKGVAQWFTLRRVRSCLPEHTQITGHCNGDRFSYIRPWEGRNDCGLVGGRSE